MTELKTYKRTKRSIECDVHRNSSGGCVRCTFRTLKKSQIKLAQPGLVFKFLIAWWGKINARTWSKRSRTKVSGTSVDFYRRIEACLSPCKDYCTGLRTGLRYWRQNTSYVLTDVLVGYVRHQEFLLGSTVEEIIFDLQLKPLLCLKLVSYGMWYIYVSWSFSIAQEKYFKFNIHD